MKIRGAGESARSATARRSLLGAVVLSGIVGVFATPAAAAPAGATAADSTCPVRTLCLWENTGFQGTRFTAQALNPATGACVDLAAHGWGAGRAESARNTANLTAVLYTNSNCTGSSYLLQPSGAYSPVTFASNSAYVY